MKSRPGTFTKWYSYFLWNFPSQFHSCKNTILILGEINNKNHFSNLGNLQNDTHTVLSTCPPPLYAGSLFSLYLYKYQIGRLHYKLWIISASRTSGGSQKNTKISYFLSSPMWRFSLSQRHHASLFLIPWTIPISLVLFDLFGRNCRMRSIYHRGWKCTRVERCGFHTSHSLGQST